VELSAAREALEELTGRRTADDLLVHIFSRFCVGK
jgi:tRNA U34 5-carboxymethylaminomethyl modifying GTPase MnmE/TrmE